MAYSRKFRGVFETLGYPYVADMKTETPDQIFAKISAGFEDRGTLQKDVTTAMQAVDARLDAYQALAAQVISKLP